MVRVPAIEEKKNKLGFSYYTLIIRNTKVSRLKVFDWNFSLSLNPEIGRSMSTHSAWWPTTRPFECPTASSVSFSPRLDRVRSTSHWVRMYCRVSLGYSMTWINKFTGNQDILLWVNGTVVVPKRHIFLAAAARWRHTTHRTSVVRVFSAFRHFFKTNVTQSVAELIQNSQKTWNCGHFLPNLVN